VKKKKVNVLLLDIQELIDSLPEQQRSSLQVAA
jgi:hypothetical protein